MVKNKIDTEIIALTLFIFDSFLPERDYSRGSTSHGSSVLIFMFLESLEHVLEWESTQS